MAVGHNEWILQDHQRRARQAQRDRFALAREGLARNVAAYTNRNRDLMIALAEEYNRVSERLSTQELMPRRGYSMPSGVKVMMRQSFRDVAIQSLEKNAEIDRLLESNPAKGGDLSAIIKVIDTIAEHMHMTNDAQSMMRAFRNKFMLVAPNSIRQPYRKYSTNVI